MTFFQCFVKVDSKTVVYQTSDKQATINDLKTFVWDKFGLHPDRQKCIYSGKRLKNDDIIQNKIDEDCNVLIWPRFIDNKSSQNLNSTNNSNI